MHQLSRSGITLATIGVLALGIYETTAKSPRFLGRPLPGWWAADRAEHATRWNPPTGIFALDKVLHEGEEAVRFYACLTGIRS